LLSAQASTAFFGCGPLQDSSGGHWNIDTVDIFRSATKFSGMLHSAQQTSHVVRRAIRTALTGRQGAVHLSLPANLMRQLVPPQQAAAISTSPFRSAARYAGECEALQRVAQLLLKAQCPALLVGHGVHRAGAWEALRRVAEALEIPVATTMKGKSALVETHPLSLGVFGFGGHPLAEAYILSEDIDVLLVVGSSLGELQTNGWDPALTRHRTVIQIDIDPLEIGKNYAVDASLVGDAALILEELAERLESEAPVKPRGNPLLERLRSQHERFYRAQDLQEGQELLKPQAVVTRMSEMLPGETLLFVDNGNGMSWVGQYYVARQTGTIHCAMSVGSMGYATAAAIGGKLAAPHRPVVVLVGDGAFAMNGMEVHTAVDYDIPVIWVVLNNGGHGMVYTGEKLLSGRSFCSVFRKPLDIAGVASGLGAQAFKIRTLEEFTQSLVQALALHRPCVLDVMVDLEEVPSTLQRRAETLKNFFGMKAE
ncbi:MAG TPA: thiamine pyrophosphate-binding protein, partial [Ktedonobacteraceae bacterium]|nr:thiamine pyrophosphate-binding protein [Ktedonobacteraceae bacterium]